MTHGRKPPVDLIPDLEVGPATAKPMRRDPVPSPNNAQSFDFELEPVSRPLPPTPNVTAASASAGDFEFDSNPNATGLELDVPSRGPQSDAAGTTRWPTAVTPDPQQITFTAEQLAKNAVYFAPPQHLFETPAYAWHVYRVQSKSRRAVAEAKAQLERAEVERDTALAQWVDTWREQLVCDERFVRMLEPLLFQTANLEAEQRDYQRHLAGAASEQQQVELLKTQLQQRLAPIHAEHHAQGGIVADTELRVAREQAKRKRIDIELRATPDADPNAPAWNARISEADASVRDANHQLDVERHKLAEVTRSMDAMLLELRRLEDSAKQAQRVKEQRVAVAQRGLFTAERSLTQQKAEIGRAALALREARYFDAPTKALLLRHDADVIRLAIEHEAMMRAIQAFDRDAVRNGLRLSMGTLALGLLLLVFRILF